MKKTDKAHKPKMGSNANFLRIKAAIDKLNEKKGYKPKKK